jgi:hypothetical protein
LFQQHIAADSAINARSIGLCVSLRPVLRDPRVTCFELLIPAGGKILGGAVMPKFLAFASPRAAADRETAGICH